MTATKPNTKFLERMELDGETSDDFITVSQHEARYGFAMENGLVRGWDVLDLGCGNGYGTSLLRTAGLHATGMDVSEEVVAGDRARFGGEFVAGDIRAIPLSDQRFDAIVCFEVIEHIEFDARAFSEMHRILKPGGRLILSTPNIRTHRAAGTNPYHIHEFAREEMEGCLQEAGFKNIEFFGQTSDHPLVKNFYDNGFIKAYVWLKRRFGIQKPIAPKKLLHTAEKVATGHSTADWKTEKIWSFVRDDDKAEIMVFLATA